MAGPVTAHKPAAAAAATAAAAAAPARPPRTREQHRHKTDQSVEKQWQRLPDRSLLQFERKGWVLTQGLLPQQQLQQVKGCIEQVVQQRKLEALRHRVRVLCPDCQDQLGSIRSEAQALALIQQHGSSELGFLQFFNLHRSKGLIAELVRSKQLAATAAQLLAAKKLRLYQDCVFLKEPGYAETNWHSDLRMAPLDANDFVTAWIPLRPVGGAEGDSGLLFAEGSHRDFALPFWHDLKGRDLGDRRYPLQDAGPMQVGDVSWHHGWTLHCAPPQPPDTPQRLALAVSYFADGARLLARKRDKSVHRHMLHDEDAESYGGWLAGMKDGAVARHEQLPLVYP